MEKGEFKVPTGSAKFEGLVRGSRKADYLPMAVVLAREKVLAAVHTLAKGDTLGFGIELAMAKAGWGQDNADWYFDRNIKLSRRRRVKAILEDNR